MMNKTNKKIMLLYNIACILALAVVTAPLLIIAKYNYPSADDWSFGQLIYQGLQSGSGFFEVLGLIFENMKISYFNWEGRFAAVLLASLQPGVWSEHYYGIVTWIMMGALILSEILLAKSLLCVKEKERDVNRYYYIPIIIPLLIMQVLYTPSAEESFFWYTGSVNYTFMYCISLFFSVLFFKMVFQELSKPKYIVYAVMATFFGILIGGNNYATSLSSTLLFLFLIGVLFVTNPKAFKKTWYPVAAMLASLLICVLSPGNAARLNGNFNGEVSMGVVEAVFQSLLRTFTNIVSWTDGKVLLVLLLILPFCWKAVSNMDFSFRFPGVFTVISFGIYASQITATIYVDGNTGGGRMAAILYYFYYLWLAANICYWLGWLSGKKRVTAWLEQKEPLLRRGLLPFCIVIGVLLVGTIYTKDLKSISSYRAYRCWRQGWAQQYALEWEERLKVLHDDSITEVVFKPLSVYPEMLLYTDLQPADGYIWVNDACASYYNKDSITVVP